MAVQFHELPVSVFPKECRPYIARLNRELRDLFGLEGSLSSERTTTRSDATVARQNIATVDISRITPSITNVVSGASTVVGVPSFTLGTVNAVGSTTTALAVDSSIALFGTALPLGSTYTGVVGTSAFSERAGHRHPHPDTLMVPGTNKILTLTDDGVAGALLGITGAFFSPTLGTSTSQLTLMALGSTTGVNIGKYGNLTLAGTNPIDQRLMAFAKADFNEPTVETFAANMSLTNTNSGGTNIATGIASIVTGTCLNSGTTVGKAIVGNDIFLSGGNTGNSKFQGSLIGARISSFTLQSGTAGTSITGVVGFQSFSAGTWTRPAVPFLYHFHSRGNPTLVVSATLGEHTGYKCEALTNGNTRCGLDVDAFTTGTPALTCGVRVGTHTAGTLRRSFQGGNSIECTANHVIVGTSGMGFVVKDTVDGNYYMISTASGVIGASSLGSTLPAV